MDESTTECDNTVVAADVIKDELVNGVDAASNPGETETIHDDGNDVVCDERKEDIATDIKDVVQSGTYFLQEGEGGGGGGGKHLKLMSLRYESGIV